MAIARPPKSASVLPAMGAAAPALVVRPAGADGVLVALVVAAAVVVISRVVLVLVESVSVSSVDLLGGEVVVEEEEPRVVVVELSLGLSDPPVIWKGREYWKTVVFDSRVILRP